MAQRVIFRFENPDSTEEWNSRLARIVSDGPYNGLLVYPTSPSSLFLNITKGDALTIEGVKIEESVDILSAVELTAGHPSRRRVDLICLYHKYIAGPTIPQGNPATYVVVTGDVPNDDITDPVVPYDKLTAYHMPLCEAHVPAGANFITESMLHNLRRVSTTKTLEDYMSEAFYYAWGNFAYFGWDVSIASPTNIAVSPGKGLLCGRVNTSTEEALVTSIRFQDYLRTPADPNTGDLYQVGQNLTLLEQPDFPTKLTITITTTTVAIAGNIYITGENELGDQILDHIVPVSQGANETATYVSDVYFSEVYHEGIDAHELAMPGVNTYIYIKDQPVNLILAVGTPTGTPIFRTELNPAYKPKCNEMIIGKAHTDSDAIVEIEDLVINPLAEWEDILDCDGVRKVFYASANAVPDTHNLWLDGTRLFPDEAADWSETHGKGYKLNGREITLGPSVPAPDTNTVLRIRYKRLG